MDYLPRLVDGQIDALLAELPAIFLTGPRATGKTTTAARRAATIVRLDREADAVAVRADPDAVLRGVRDPILLDELQVMPGVLGAVKRAVDADPRPGRFLVTGSVRGDFDGDLWPGTGRLTRVPMYGMTVREQLGLGLGTPFLDRVAAGTDLVAARGTPDLRGYVDLALHGSFPEPALRLVERARRAWFESYIDDLLTRDAEQVDGGRDPVRPLPLATSRRCVTGIPRRSPRASCSTPAHGRTVSVSGSSPRRSPRCGAEGDADGPRSRPAAASMRESRHDSQQRSTRR